MHRGDILPRPVLSLADLREGVARDVPRIELDHPLNVKDDFNSQRTTIPMAKKPKSRTVAVRLISMAMTGYYKTFSRPRTHRPLSMLKYDPVGMAHPRAETTCRCTDMTCSQEEGSIPRAEEGWEIGGFAE